MQNESEIAFKEWAAVCAALVSGRQMILARKGGIDEGPNGFRPEHPEFWLLPTYFHERPELLQPADRALFDTAEADAPPADQVRIGAYATVVEIFQLRDEGVLPQLAPFHVYGPETLRQRFHYRQPGLFLLATRIYQSPQQFELPVWPELAGCRSWVELPKSLPTSQLTSVLNEDEFAERLTQLRAVLK